jgi:hypothetical protein
LFQVGYVTVACFVLLNLFTAVLWANYVLLARSIQGLGLLTDRQREWIHAQTVLLRARPLSSVETQKMRGVRRFAAMLVESRPFSWFMLIVLIANAALLGAVHWNMTVALRDGIFWSNVGFTFAFVLEAVLRVVGHGVKLYWRVRWNRFDLVITASSILDVVLTAVYGSSSSIGVLISILRLTRVLRLIRLARKYVFCVELRPQSSSHRAHVLTNVLLCPLS